MCWSCSPSYAPAPSRPRRRQAWPSPLDAQNPPDPSRWRRPWPRSPVASWRNWPRARRPPGRRPWPSQRPSPGAAGPGGLRRRRPCAAIRPATPSAVPVSMSGPAWQSGRIKAPQASPATPPSAPRPPSAGWASSWGGPAWRRTGRPRRSTPGKPPSSSSLGSGKAAPACFWPRPARAWARPWATWRPPRPGPRSTAPLSGSRPTPGPSRGRSSARARSFFPTRPSEPAGPWCARDARTISAC